VTEYVNGDKVTVVETDPVTRQPIPGGQTWPATVVDLTEGQFTWLFVRVRMPNGQHAVFWRESRWLKYPDNSVNRWRLEEIPHA
jgi:hypothetical protein